MPLDIIVGAQWGDEGKGRMVDYLAARASYVARYNGCLLYTSPSPRDRTRSRMPSSA